MLGPRTLDIGVEESYLDTLQLPRLHTYPSSDTLETNRFQANRLHFLAKHICEVLGKKMEGCLKQEDSSCNVTEHGAPKNWEGSGVRLPSDTTMTG